MTVASGTFLSALVLLLYAPISLIALRWLLPRLSPTTRLLAIGMLAAQIVILAVGLLDMPRWQPTGWMWHLDQEWNIPSTFASVQLALVGAAAFLAALLADSRQVLHRLNLVVIGALFLLFAWDEYFYLHEDNMPLKLAYVTVGALIAIVSTKLALRRPGRARLWQISLMAGMALYVFGAVVLEPFHEYDLRFFPLEIEGSIRVYNLEEALEYLGVWLVLVAVLGNLTDARAKLGRLMRFTLFALPVFWIALLTQDAWIPRVELRFLAQPAAVQFEAGVQLFGYRIEKDDDALKLWLYPSAWRSIYSELGFSLHLIDQASGASVASRNLHSDLQARLLQAPGYAHVYRQMIALEIPAQTPANRAYWIVLSIWRETPGDYLIQPVVASDHKTLGNAQVVLGELVLPSKNAPSSAVPLAVFDNGFALTAPNIPDSAIRGTGLPILFSWTAEKKGGEDYIQFLHFVHSESGEQWGFDQQPLGARLPTRLWYSGMAEGETWALPLPADLAPGRYDVFTGLYRLSDMERLPASDANGTPFVDARVPLGKITIASA